MRLTSTIACAIALTAYGWLTPASAQTKPAATKPSDKPYYYIGASFGRMDTDINSSSFVAFGAAVTAKTEKSNGWKAYAGYQFYLYFGVELSQVSFKPFSASGSVGAARFSGTQKISGTGVALTGTMPMTSKFAFTGKVGALYEKSQVTRTVGAASQALNDRDWLAFYGAGVKYSFTPNIAVRAEVERFSMGHGDAGNFYSAGAQFSF